MNCFDLLSRKNAGRFAFTFPFLTLHHYALCLRFFARNFHLCNVASKQVTGISLVLKDSDTESENLSLLIRLSVSDGQKTDSSKVVSYVSCKICVGIVQL